MARFEPAEERPAAPIVITHQAGVRFAAQIGAHEMILDQPLSGGGHDAGPSPIELLGVSLGSCVALYVHRFLVTRGMADEGLRVEVTQHSMRNPNRVSRFELRIVVSRELPAHYQAMLQGVARACPAYNTLSRSADITVEIESGLGAVLSHQA